MNTLETLSIGHFFNTFSYSVGNVLQQSLKRNILMFDFNMMFYEKKSFKIQL